MINPVGMGSAGGCMLLSPADPLLDALGDNGGRTPTLALQTGSPAIDAADGTACANAPVGNKDQRGYTRNADGFSVCDLGAVEFGAVAPAPDTMPDPFSFPNAANVALNSLVASRVVLPEGYDSPATVSVRNGEYRIDGGLWTSVPGVIYTGQTLQLRMTSASTGRSMAVVVGSYTASFITRTASTATDTDPDVFSIANQANANLNVFATSRAVTPTGYNAAAPVTVAPAGCYYVTNGGAPGNATGTISPGQTLQLATQTPATNSTKFFCDVTVGSTKVRWIGKTKP